VVGLLLIAGTLLTVWHLSRPILSTQDSALRTEAAPAALPLPDKPSIVVLPFMNLSEDPKQEYFSDGLTEVLTNDLSKLSGLFVIARNSAFTYKGKAVKVQDVGRELGVRYVLEGGVLKSGDQLRITAQLVDAITGHHLWSERYDRPLRDVFTLQDEITQRIIAALEVKLTAGEQEGVWRKYTDNLAAYDSYLRGVEYFYRATKEENLQARQMFERAIALDPEFAGAYAYLGLSHWLDWIWLWSPDPARSLEQAFELAQKAVALDDSLAEAHTILGFVYLYKRQHAQAVSEGERALVLDPNDADAHARLGLILAYSGRPQEAVRQIEKAMRLSPNYPAPYLVFLGQAYRLMGRHEEAIAVFQRALTRMPNFLFAYVALAISYNVLGRDEKAQEEVKKILNVNPNFSLEVARERLPHKDPIALGHDLTALRQAGLK